MELSSDVGLTISSGTNPTVSSVAVLLYTFLFLDSSGVHSFSFSLVAFCLFVCALLLLLLCFCWFCRFAFCGHDGLGARLLVLWFSHFLFYFLGGGRTGNHFCSN